MTEDFKKKVYQDAVEYYGIPGSFDITTEGCSEFVQAIARFRRSSKASEILKARNNVREKMAKVLIAFEMVKAILSINDKELAKEIEYETARMKARMEDDR